MVRTAIKFGLYVALCMVLLVYLASTIGNTSALGLIGQGEDTYAVEAHFADVSGLLEGDNVKVAGVPVGKVTSIDVESGKAVVGMEIDEDRPFPSDSTASIRWRNLIGQRYVYLHPGDAPTMLDDGGDPITETESVVDLGELFNRLGPIVATIDESEVNEFLDTVTHALDGNAASVSQALDDLAILVQGLGERDEAIGRLIENVEVVSRTIADRDAQIETLLDNLAVLAQTFSDNTELLETALVEVGAFNRDLSDVLATNREELDRLIGNLDHTLDIVEAQLGPLDVALGNLDDTGAAIFRTSRDGTWLNEAILCLTVVPPPCPTPPISGLDGLIDTLLGQGVGGAQSTDAVPYRGAETRGTDAILSIFGAEP